ncbi:MAG: hypothetical protein ACKVQA_11955 [Burkholderiales bacterium]
MRTSILRLLAVALLLHAQAVLAFAPCVSASATPAMAFSDMPEDCGMRTEAALCLAHCQAADQSGAHAQIPALPAMDTVVLWLPYSPSNLVPSGQWHPRHAQRGTGPPPLDLFCSLNL